MQLDLTLHKGKKDKPVVILIHGLGMDKNIWVDPMNTKIFAKNIPLKVFAATKPHPSSLKCLNKITIGEIPESVNNLWDVLRDNGFNMLCWSQRRPAGPIKSALEELDIVMESVERLFPKKPVAIIGHSRGGLIARKFMEKKRLHVKAVITISTPHEGSRIGLLGKYIKPFSSILKKIIPRDSHGALSRVIKNINELIEGNAIKELLSDSEFLKNLRDFPQRGVKYISFGGTEPRLITFYIIKDAERPKEAGRNMTIKPLFSIPDSLLKVFPSFMITEEMTQGRGDGLVSARSSLYPWASEHYNLSVNHITILWSSETISKTIEVLKTI